MAHTLRVGYDRREFRVTARGDKPLRSVARSIVSAPRMLARILFANARALDESLTVGALVASGVGRVEAVPCDDAPAPRAGQRQRAALRQSRPTAPASARAAKTTQGPGRAADRDRGVNGRRPRRRRRRARGVRADGGRARVQAEGREEAACDLPRLRGLRL